MRSRKHSGFSVDRSVHLEAGDQEGVQLLIQYFLRCPFSQARMIEVTEAGKGRGRRAKTLPRAATGTGLPARPPTAREARKGWAALIKQVYEADPLLKMGVAQRLANLALAKTYGKKGAAIQSPLYQKMTVEEDKVRI